MLPLIGLAATFVPDLIRLIAGDKAGTLASAVSQTVVAVAKTSDPAEALKTLEGDAAAAADLRARLAQIAVDAQRAQNEEADRQRQDALASFQTTIGDVRDARGSMVSLAQAKSGIAWGAPVVSLVVTSGFFVILALLVFYGRTISGEADAMVSQIINISLGTLATAFATVVNFWLGSSQGSRAKDSASLQMQTSHAAQISDIIGTVRTVTSKAVEASAPASASSVMPLASQTVAAADTRAATDNFDVCVAATLAYEGGFSDNPDDPGGVTNFGITKRTLEAFLGRPVSVDEMRDLSSATAIEVYRANYWNHLRCGDLPAGVDLMVFDYGVNSGPATAARALQGLAGVTQDGAIGRVTLAAVAAAQAATLVDSLASARLSYLRALPGFATFGNGWSRRVEDIRQKAHQMAA
ncbi:MAG: glycoside hydrolase family 108 protein [Proteobacteria bacterium]|nr:glycoside hydrolase family 108 protein [Pseudomonadota bacterium]